MNGESLAESTIDRLTRRRFDSQDLRESARQSTQDLSCGSWPCLSGVPWVAETDLRGAEPQLPQACAADQAGSANVGTRLTRPALTASTWLGLPSRSLCSADSKTSAAALSLPVQVSS